jgi:hypothetical protein
VAKKLSLLAMKAGPDAAFALPTPYANGTFNMTMPIVPSGMVPQQGGSLEGLRAKSSNGNKSSATWTSWQALQEFRYKQRRGCRHPIATWSG